MSVYDQGRVFLKEYKLKKKKNWLAVTDSVILWA